MRGQGGVGWNRKKFPESNLHVYGTDDTLIMVYNTRGWARKRDRKNTRGRLRKNIVTRFKVPYALISDNGLQFDSKAFRKYCSDLSIKNRYSTPAYPQGNGQAEAVNKAIVNGLKKRLDDAKGKWVEELPHVLWTYQTTPRQSTGETPFSMTYGVEAVIPLETGFPTLRTSAFTSDGNDKLLKKSLDLIEEWRENAMVQLAYYQHKLKQGYDTNVKLRSLVPRDLVLRKVLGNTKNPAWGKLGPNWEGPYRVTSMAGIGAYYLEDLDEKNCTSSLDCKQPKEVLLLISAILF